MTAPSKKKQQNPKQNDGPKCNKASQKQFKAKQTKNKKSFSNDAVVKDASIALQLEDDVPDFPRGFSTKSLNLLKFSAWFPRKIERVFRKEIIE
jgi:rRNA biogenesis protein RRP5